MSIIVEIPCLTRQVGWMRCVACSDSILRPGWMWLGVTRAGVDDWIICPECMGTSQVPRYEIVNALTGERIDYEAQGVDSEGRRFYHVPLKSPEQRRS